MHERPPSPSPDGEIARALGARLKALRAERGWSQRALAGHLEISGSSIAKYEAGVHTPPLAVLLRLAALFDVGLDHLAGRVAEVTPLRDRRLIRCLREIAAMDEGSRELVTVALQGLVNAYRILRYRRSGPTPAGLPPGAAG